MTMAREAIAMTREELLAFLAAQRWVALGTLDPDGTPVGDLAPVRLDGEELRFAVPRGSRADDNIRRDPRVCCAADEFPTYFEIRGATAHGRATPCDETHPLGPDWCEYAIPLDDVASFDFKKIRTKY
jgi:nitroimidazol reductase NimA-like FMN-containing flavoprotein (pyridoxamine 5'-phosphate oxidase superfamily)